MPAEAGAGAGTQTTAQEGEESGRLSGARSTQNATRCDENDSEASMLSRADRLIPSRLRWLLGDRIHIVIALTATALLTGLCEAFVLAILAEAASALVTGAHTVHVSAGPLSLQPNVGVLLLIAGGLGVIRAFLGIAQSYLPPRISGNVQARLRRELLGAFLGSSWAIQAEDREGHLQEVMSNQANQASQAAIAATGLVGSILAFLALTVTALALNPLAVLVVMLMAGVLFGILQPLRTKGRERARALSTAQMDFANIVGETNRIAEETQVFGVAAAQSRRVDIYIERALELFVSTQALVRLVPNVYQSILYLFIIAGLGFLYVSGAGQISALGAVVLLLIRAGTYGQAIQGGYQIVHQSLPFVDRVREKAEEYEHSAPPAGHLTLDRVERLAFDHVDFSYRSDALVLSDIDFEVAAGEAIAIAGPSGAGKSSIVQVLLRLREPTAGTYLVNGIPATDFSREDWHRRVAYVAQEPHLIHASVAENIRFFRDISDAQIERAARLAHIHDDVVGWVDGYDSIVGPRADAVSGGQQQRICLARALVSDPDLLILDEPTSALDPRSEALVKRSLNELKADLTLFVVAHGSTLLDLCDRAMIVIDGRLEAFGTTAALAAEASHRQSIAGLGLEHFREKIA